MNSVTLKRKHFLPAILAAIWGCSGSEPAPEPKAPTPATTASPEAASTREYKLTGVVRKVVPDSGLVTIRHEEIPGFMNAMTMPFTVKDKKSLEDVRAGDEVEGTLLVVKEAGEVKDYELKDLVVSRPAPAPALSLNLATGKLEERQEPRVLKPGEIVPDFAMTAQDGKEIRLSDYRGKVVGLTFIYTRCPLPDFCPRMDRKFADLSASIGAVSGRAEHVRLLSVSFDPEHDTPEILARHAATQGAKPPLWTFAVAAHPELAKVAALLGLNYGPARDEVIHNLVIAIIDEEGKLLRLETGNSARDAKPADLLKTIYSSISETKK